MKKCLVKTPADSSGMYSVTCPVEKQLRKIIPLEKLPPDAKVLFSDVNKVGGSWSCFRIRKSEHVLGF